MWWLNRLVSKYTGVLRSWKGTYVLNNILNFSKLRKNRDTLDKLGLTVSAVLPIGTKDLPQTDDLPWLDLPDAKERMVQHPDWSFFGKEIQDQLLSFPDMGFMVLKGFYSKAEINNHNEIIDRLQTDGLIDVNYSGTKLMDVYKENETVDIHFFRNERLMKILAFIFQKEVLPFQTIHFKVGSQQKAHSDSIHMSTYPPGYLAAAWTALEEIGMDQGPIFYYPGSHKLPYVSCEDYSSGNTYWTIGPNSYKRYEAYIEALVKKEKLIAEFFTPQPGDVLIWHANLLHGGSAIKNSQKTRRSMVAHYYADGVFCYHEISQRAALIDDH
jgi:hypothetical protein